jgi:hypothetical protein
VSSRVRGGSKTPEQWETTQQRRTSHIDRSLRECPVKYERVSRAQVTSLADAHAGGLPVGTLPPVLRGGLTSCRVMSGFSKDISLAAMGVSHSFFIGDLEGANRCVYTVEIRVFGAVHLDDGQPGGRVWRAPLLSSLSLLTNHTQNSLAQGFKLPVFDGT